MNVFRSQSDEQLAARWDDRPYRCLNGDRLTAREFAQRKRVASHEPRVECIPSRDRCPFRIDGVRADRSALDRVWSGGEGALFDPRPEFARPPVNRILSAFREATDGHRREILTHLQPGTVDFMATGDYGHIVGPEEIEHARKVLTRLAALA